MNRVKILFKKISLYSTMATLISCGQALEAPEIFVIEHAQRPGELPQSIQNIAVIIEPRAHPLLIPIVENMIQILGDDWKIQIFHGTQNGAFIRDSRLKEKIDGGQIYLTQINRDNLNISAYNALLLGSHFWENVLGENVLIFQTDTVLCSGSKHKIEDFLKYDYVGAPWDEKKHPRYCNLSNGRRVSVFVGNGGLSFRKRSKILKVLERFRLPETRNFPNEDIFFSCATLEPGSDFTAPSVEAANNFSVETVFNPKPFGVHKPWSYLSKAELDTLGQSCAELDSILKPYYKW